MALVVNPEAMPLSKWILMKVHLFELILRDVDLLMAEMI